MKPLYRRKGGADDATTGPAAAGAGPAAAAGPGVASSEFHREDFEPLYRAAYGDFLHDFNEPGRSDVTLSILNKVPIEYAKAPSKNYTGLTKLIVDAKEDAKKEGRKSDDVPAQAFHVFKDRFNLTMPGKAVPKDNAEHEEQVLQMANIDYGAMMAQLTRDNARAMAPLELALVDLGFTNKHPYNVTAAATKAEGARRPLADIFNGLAGGPPAFVLMWDAGAISITRLAEDAVGGPYHFFFVRSKENLSDPAGKISAESMRSSKNVRVYFLEDEPTHVSQYPFYAGGGTTNENLFSNFTLTTQLNPEKKDSVSGTISITKKDGPSVSISVPDIGVQSEVSEVVVKTVHMELNGDPDEQIMPYYFLKRAGDWCQALCLLDRSRNYIVKRAPGYDGDDGWEFVKDVTLPDGSRTSVGFLESYGALIAMITLDRIMLAFVIAAGLHVFFTNVRGGANWLVFFRNMEAGKVDDWDALVKESETMAGVGKSIKDAYTAIVNWINTTEPAPTRDYIVNLRGMCLLLKSIPSPQSVDDTLATIESVKTQAPTPTVVATLRNAIAKLKTSQANLPALELTLSGEDGKLADKITTLIAKISGNAPISRNDSGFSAFRSFIDDIRTVKQSAGFSLPALGFPTGAPFPSTRASTSATSPGEVLQQQWDTLISATGGGRMKGGGASTFDDCYSIYAYYDNNDESIALAALLELSGAITAPTKSRIVLPNGFVATVVDDILIDPDTEGVLGMYARGDPYATLRYEILEYDKIRMELQQLKSADALDSFTKLKIMDISSRISGTEKYENPEDFVDAWLTGKIGYPSLNPDDPSMFLGDPTPYANAAMLAWVVTQEETILNICNARIDDGYREYGFFNNETEVDRQPFQEILGIDDDMVNTRIGEIKGFDDILEAAEDADAGEIFIGINVRMAEAEDLLSFSNGRNGGGLRTRRPLYSNARPTPSLDVDGASKHEGLRKRTGARTHRRLRKSSRLTRRR